LGILAYHLISIFSEANKVRGLILLVLSLLSMPLFYNLEQSYQLLSKEFLLAISFLLLILALYFYPIKLLVNPLTQFMGKISYSLYLTHFMILELLAIYFPDGFFVNSNSGFIFTYVLVLIISTLFSLLVHHAIEKPGIKFGKRLIKRD